LSEIVLLADPALAPILAQTLLIAHPLTSPKTLMRAHPILTVTPIHTLDGLLDRCARPLAGARLLTCGTDVIVPRQVLDAFSGPSYNIHPGPPDYPGRFPSVFALYDETAVFGTTVHEMTAQVDDGPIVAVDRFPIPEGADRASLEALSFMSVLRLLTDLCPALVRFEALPHSSDVWSGRPKRQADFDALCHLPEELSAVEFARRYRAVGEGPDHALDLMVFGHRFRLDNRRDSAITVGGCLRPSSASS
ncbi:MAG: hypothetical protein JXQ84_04860, partial [Rhodospirillaceae bacterium]|nr:hypothetical protein [Rhodospirillaceae bacterium]